MPLDSLRNPYTPGAGQSPAVLSGRQPEIADFQARLQRLAHGRSAQCTLMVGLRGVGKTVLLNRFAAVALEQAWVVVEHELTPNADLLATVARLSKEALLQLAPLSALKKAGQRVASVLAGLEVGYGIAGLRLAWSGDGDVRTSSGDAARDLTELLVGLGEAALEHDRGVAFMFDELQFAPVEPLAAFVTGLHKVAQRSLPLTAVAAGLPQTRGVLAEAVSYSERMFETRTVGALGDADARAALAGPAAEEGVDLSEGALTEAVRFTEGYPFFLQVFGDHLWRTAGRSPVTQVDAELAAPKVRDWLDRGFFTFRADRLPTAQRRYLRAMAELGPGEHASGDIAAELGLESSAPVGRTREALIQRGLVYSPRLGYAAFTVPQFDDFLRRHYELEPHSPRHRRRS